MERVQRRSRPEHPVSDAPVQRKSGSTAESSGAAGPAGPSSAAAASATGGSWDADAGLMSAMGLDASPVQMEESAAPAPADPEAEADAAAPESETEEKAAEDGSQPAADSAAAPAGEQKAAAAVSGADGAATTAMPGGEYEAAAEGQPAVAPPAAEQAGDSKSKETEAAADAEPAAESEESESESESAAASESEGDAVQGKDMDQDLGGVHQAAAAGISGAGGTLPHLDAIQASFGSHDVAGVQSHTDSAAAGASQEMGAEAYATGNHVAFGRGAPSLHTAAHEAAHVVQQRGGVHLKGGVGEAGDSWEQHADAVADRVVQGQSAQDLLDPVAGGAGGGDGGPVQMKKAKEFEPDVTGGGFTLAGLNMDLDKAAKVSNAKKAPKGTKFEWVLSEADQYWLRDTQLIGTGPNITMRTHTARSSGDNAAIVRLDLNVTDPKGTTVLWEGVTYHINVMTPQPEFSHQVKPGNKKKSGTGPDDLRKGDELTVNVQFGLVRNPRDFFSKDQDFKLFQLDGTFTDKIGKQEISHDRPFSLKEQKWSGDTLSATVYTDHAGTGSLSLQHPFSGKVETWNLTAVASREETKARLTQALARHRSLVALIHAYLSRCYVAYNTGFEAMKAALKRQRDADEMTRDILLGVLFAGLGGIAGGAVGGIVSAAVKPSQGALDAAGRIGRAYLNAKAGGLTDGAKDMVKYGTRVFLTQVSKTSNGTPGGMDDAGHGPAVAPERAGVAIDAGAVAGVNPLDWYEGLKQAALDEEVTMSAAIEQGMAEVENLGDDAVLTVDPVNYVTNSVKLDDKVATDLGSVPVAEDYERSFWEAWIAVYSHSVYLKKAANCMQEDTSKVRNNVGGKLEEEMERVAAELAKKGVDASWLKNALGAAQARAEREADGKSSRNRL